MKQLVPILIALAIIVGVGGPCILFALTWDKAPWWRTNPTPRRQIDIDKDLIKLHRLHERHPDVFGTEPTKESAA